MFGWGCAAETLFKTVPYPKPDQVRVHLATQYKNTKNPYPVLDTPFSSKLGKFSVLIFLSVNSWENSQIIQAIQWSALGKWYPIVDPNSNPNLWEYPPPSRVYY